jgi:hypothetical protein
MSKLKRSAVALAGLVIAICAPAFSANPPQALLGRWDLTVKTPQRDYPSWLEVSRHDGELQCRFVGRFGHARVLPKCEYAQGKLTFVSPKADEETPSDLVFQARLAAGRLTGTTTGAEAPWQWTGVRAPSLKRSRPPQWGASLKLFDGKDLRGWHSSDPKQKQWTVENGTLVSPGHGAELISDRKFGDFKLHVEFNCAKGANSGVYLRGRYELQIENDAQPEGPTMRTGGIYGFLAPSPEQPRRPGVWQTYDITLVGRTVTVEQNGHTIINHQEIPGITGGALDSHEGLPGPIYLQGSEAGHVSFRNLVITPAR